MPSEFENGLPPAGQSRELLLPGPAGALETIVAVPAQLRAPPAFCVVSHPHPLHGGAMTNKVAYALASSALKAGLVAARFNFRGVGRSQGRHDDGRGEVLDAIAVVDWLRAQMPGAAAVLAGFSFGAWISLKASAQVHPRLLVTISPPFGRYVDGAPPPPPGCPWLAVHSTDDEVVSYDETAAALRRYDPPPQLVTLEGAGHFYHGRLGDLQAAVLPFLEGGLGRSLPPPAAG